MTLRKLSPLSLCDQDIGILLIHIIYVFFPSPLSGDGCGEVSQLSGVLRQLTDTHGGVSSISQVTQASVALVGHSCIYTCLLKTMHVCIHVYVCMYKGVPGSCVQVCEWRREGMCDMRVTASCLLPLSE